MKKTSTPLVGRKPPRIERKPSGSAYSSSPRYSRGIGLLAKIYCVLIVGIVAVLAYFYQSHMFSDEYLTAVAFEYPADYSKSCQNKSSTVADHLKQTHGDNVHFSVTTPTNYRSDFAHPLLVVWAPSGMSEKFSERFVGLTREATQQGYVVVHTRSVPLGMKSLEALSGLPSAVIENWCVDSNLVFYTGHSDGGTVSNALSVMPESAFHPRAIAPSAMGMQGKDMAVYKCPSPTNVMLMHNKGDGHFPGYGVEVAQWWANCNQCASELVQSEYTGCVEYTACSEGVSTLFCEAEGNHAHWPGPEHDPIRFFSSIVESTR